MFSMKSCFVVGMVTLAANALPYNVSSSVHARQGPDLSGEPSVTEKMYLYRAVVDRELQLTKDRLGKNPGFMRSSRGDFNIEGTDSLYFFHDPDAASDYCDVVMTMSHLQINECAVATYSWTPPPQGFRLKRFTTGDAEWKEYVQNNWSGAMQHSIQQKNDWVEGPLSELFGAGYVASELGDMQYCLLNKDLLAYMSVFGVGDGRKCNHNEKRQEALEPACEPLTLNDHARQLVKTNMGQRYW